MEGVGAKKITMDQVGTLPLTHFLFFSYIVFDYSSFIFLAMLVHFFQNYGPTLKRLKTLCSGLKSFLKLITQHKIIVLQYGILLIGEN
jgi:hypothetical protein